MLPLKNPKRLSYLVANFGGPRNLEEIHPFLQALLTDTDVIDVGLPKFLHNLLFKAIARMKTKQISSNYTAIGGKSPIFEDTEAVAKELRERLGEEVITFHRYLPTTHPSFIEAIQKLSSDEIRVFPMFPQFTYATTGSIARWFRKRLPFDLVRKMRWVKSYPTHPAYIAAQRQRIEQHLESLGLKACDTVLLFSANGAPQQYINRGDVYEDECIASYEAIKRDFPDHLCRLSFQSKFGPGEWLKPYTIDVCESVLSWHEGRKNIVFIPLSFTSDHIETLFEIENDYLPIIKEAGLNASRVPALNLDEAWLRAITTIATTEASCANQMLIRRD